MDYGRTESREKRSKSRERRRSRSQSPDYREDRRTKRREEPDDWRRKSEAFLQKLNVPPPGGDASYNQQQAGNKIQTMMGNTGPQQQAQQMTAYPTYSYPPPHINYGAYPAPATTATPPVAPYMAAPPSSITQSSGSYPPQGHHREDRRRHEQQDRGR